LIEWLLLNTFKSVSAKVKWLALIGLGTAIIFVLIANWGGISAAYSVRDFNLAERLLTETRVLWFYVQQLLAPIPATFGLFHDDITISRGIFAPPATLIALAAWFVTIALALSQHACRPIFAFAVFWFLGSHLLESTFFPLEIAYEHRNYIASFGILLWLASLIYPESNKAFGRIPRLALALSFLFFCGLVTSLRSLQWADEFQRSQVEAADHPDSARANYQAATVVLQRTYESGGGNPMAYQMIQFHYKRASELDENSKAPLVGLLYLDCIAGAHKNAANLNKVLQRFASSRFSFGDRSLFQSLSGLLNENRLCLEEGEVNKLTDAALSNPTADSTMRGMIYALAMDYAAINMHNAPLALAYAQAAVASDAGSVALRVNLIHLYIQSNLLEQARQEYENLNTWKISPRNLTSVNELKTIFETLEINATNRKPVG
jgi:hypothetical protein